ncbi:hypothetical protein R77591_04894 [Ralstonia mannitolilytica]|uniref:Uncharacterized protein n=1 Tax=Ralstonia mannitolilytica TaxID=105219 RepID=A0AAD2B1E8_9RALS|nr:hypothetical protein R77591_04894 [Ralstonia mannitolilytica]
MIFLRAILWLVVAPVVLVVAGLVWLWLGHKLLAHMFGS